jgi:hypothetical protein
MIMEEKRYIKTACLATMWGVFSFVIHGVLLAGLVAGGGGGPWERVAP